MVVETVDYQDITEAELWRRVEVWGYEKDIFQLTDVAEWEVWNFWMMHLAFVV